MAKNEAATQERKPGPFKVTVTAYRCRCGYEWLAKGNLNNETVRPAVCPECKSPRWDRPYKFRDAERVKRSTKS